MDHKNIIPCQRPRFEIAEVDSEGNESVGIYSLREYAREFEEVCMDRKGFCKLSLFMQMAVGLAVNLPVSSRARESGTEITLTRAPFSSDAGEIVKIDPVDPEEAIICVKLSPDNQGAKSDKRHGTTFVRNLKVGDIVTVTTHQPENSLSQARGGVNAGDIPGQVVSIDFDNNIVCIQVGGDAQGYGEEKEPGDEPNHQGLREGYTVYLRATDIEITELRELHLKTGGVINCGPIWIKGETIYFARGGGTIGVLIKNINIPKSLTETYRRKLDGETFEETPIYGSGSGQSRRKSGSRKTRKTRPRKTKKSKSRKPKKCGRSTRRCS